MKKNKKRGAVFEVFERSEIHRFCSTLPLYIFNYMINISFQYLMTDKRYIIQHYTRCISSSLFQASYNSSFTSLSLLLSWLSLISEDSAFGSEVGFSVLGADVGFWILKGIEAFFLRNLYNATTVRSTSTLICKHQSQIIFVSFIPTRYSRFVKAVQKNTAYRIKTLVSSWEEKNCWESIRLVEWKKKHISASHQEVIILAFTV